MTEQEKQKLQEEFLMAASTGQVGNMIDLIKQIPTVYFSYDAREDRKKFPKTFEDLKQFLIENSNGSLEDGFDDDQLDLAVFVNPRMLYDYLDSRGVSIGVEKSDQGVWSYNYNSTSHSGPSIKNRHDAEREGIQYAFGLIEQKLGKP